MIHTLEAFDKDTGHRVKRGSLVTDQAQVTYELVGLMAAVDPGPDDERFLVLATNAGLRTPLCFPPSYFGLFVRDLTKPDYSSVKRGLVALEMMADALADLTLRETEPQRLGPLPVEVPTPGDELRSAAILHEVEAMSEDELAAELADFDGGF